MPICTVALARARRWNQEMSTVPTLQTDRLELASVAPDDRDFGERLHRDPMVRRHLGGPTADDRLPAVLRGYLSCSQREAVWVVRTAADGEAIGLVTLTEHKDGQDIELSCQFLPASWGQGYATEAARAILCHAKVGMGLSDVIAETQGANAPSRRLLERLGMTRRGSVHRFGHEQAIYGL